MAEDDGTYCTVYTVRLSDALYVQHACRKKSTQGRKTPDRYLQIVKTRFREAERMAAEWRAQQAHAGDTLSSQNVYFEPGSA